MTKSIKISNVEITLPFNPISKDYLVLNEGKPYFLTPAQARYILINHNKDNRPISKTQSNKIRKGIENKFRKDGQPITFNTNGDLTEKQHTLSAIAQMPDDGREYPFLIAVGVEPDCFSTAVPAKSRTPKDEVQRKDPSCTATEYSTLAAIIGRQGGTITNYTIVSDWELWKIKIRAAISTCDEFWDKTKGQVFTQIKSTVHAFAAISHVVYKEGQLRMILDQLIDHLDPESPSTPLAESLYTFFITNTGDGELGHNKQKEKFLFKSLCIAMDRIIENIDGDLNLGLTLDENDKEKMLLSKVVETETYKKYTTVNPMSKR